MRGEIEAPAPVRRRRRPTEDHAGNGDLTNGHLAANGQLAAVNGQISRPARRSRVEEPISQVKHNLSRHEFYFVSLTRIFLL